MEVRIVKHQQYGEFRVATDDDKKYYVARDFAAALNYARPEGFVSRHVSKENKILVPLRAKHATNVVKTVLVTEKGLDEMVKATPAVHAKDLKEWLITAASAPAVEESEDLPEVVTIEGVRGYLDDEGTAYLNVEDVARGLGFVELKTAQVATSGESLPPYMAVRWGRINQYRAEFNLKPVKAGDFIPENEFYLLAMKANNATAKKFQLKVANKILPSIRKNGFYFSEPVSPNEEATRLKKQFSKFDKFEFAVVYVFLMSNGMVKIGMTGNLTERIKQIKAQTGLYPLDLKTTPFLLKDDAAKFETFLKQKYAAHCVGGEYFDVKFTAICAEF